MDLPNTHEFSGYFLLFAALILIVVGDFLSFIVHNSPVGNLLVWLGIFVAVFGIFALIG